jgi:DNA repair exonuclease SbcCD ATPase subunit
MVKKPRRGTVQNIVKNLLDSDIPEIQYMANKMAEQIKDIEEESFRLQEYVAQIQNMATDDANALAKNRIAQLLTDLEAALKELRLKPKKALPPVTEIRAITPRRAEVEKTPEQEEEEEAEEPEGEITPGSGHMLERIITPEGYVIKKVRY